jgi:hypothetical protein
VARRAPLAVLRDPIDGGSSPSGESDTTLTSGIGPSAANRTLGCCYTGGCYHLQGDGVTVAYSWVWVPTAPAAPPAPPDR